MPKPLNSVFADLPTTIFTVVSDLAGEHRAINPGRGFPDTGGRAETDIPLGASCRPAAPSLPEKLVRFCFCRRREVLEEALRGSSASSAETPSPIPPA